MLFLEHREELNGLEARVISLEFLSECARMERIVTWRKQRLTEALRCKCVDFLFPFVWIGAMNLCGSRVEIYYRWDPPHNPF